jgi:glycerophosphoryl diester phosphodiesterase
LRVLEQLVLGRHADPERCEDGVVVTPHYAAVVDGATAKYPIARAAATPGRLAMETVVHGIEALRPDGDVSDASARLSAMLADAYERMPATHGEQPRPTASAAIFSAARREVWLFGDCQCRIGRRVIQRSAPHEAVMARFRALAHQVARCEGMPEEEIVRADPGRACVLPMLDRITRLNDRSPDSPFGMGALNGLPVRPDRIVVVPVPPAVRTLVLATDGYPAVLGTLAATEAELARVLDADPLCERLHLRLKGLPPGGRSFDDRAYLRLRLD